ncbi:profilin-4 isoform X1 [Mesocricetus auratus]|uniref:Profilin-4 isoform X1 n=1 Tax=Mesocricetus auratus TaxID=10036 RepID=A0ABM2W7R7_MESAU|nr:profilin-4 isoform X1 [Mesocricetus auratus]
MSSWRRKQILHKIQAFKLQAAQSPPPAPQVIEGERTSESAPSVAPWHQARSPGSRTREARFPFPLLRPPLTQPACAGPPGRAGLDQVLQPPLAVRRALGSPAPHRSAPATSARDRGSRTRERSGLCLLDAPPRAPQPPRGEGKGATKARAHLVERLGGERDPG